MISFTLGPLSLEILDGDIADRATRSALATAAAHGLASVAFPAFGTGVGGFPLEECARIMIDAIRDIASSSGSVTRVRLVLYGRAPYETFVRAARLAVGAHGPA